MYCHLKWLKCTKKKVLVLVLIYLMCSLYLVTVIRPLMYPEDIDCSVYRETLSNSHPEAEFDFQKLISNVSMLNTSAKKENWFQVAKNTFVYSAYHIKCPSKFSFPHCVQLIGITLNATHAKTVISNLKCAIKSNSKVIKGMPALIERLEEGHFLPYTAAFFYCDLKNFRNVPPSFQATVYDQHPSKWFPVRSVDFKKLPQGISVSVCVRPFYGDYPNFNLHLTEFLLYYVTMGVDHFIFYNQNITESALQFLNFVASTDLSVVVLPWDVPLGVNELHEYGQIVFTQDCLARSRYKYSHTIIVDLDEFVAPKKHRSISDLLMYLDDYYPYAGSYNLPMVLFCEEFSAQSSDSFPKLSRNRRQKTAWEYMYRTKYIARPDRVRYGGIHFVWKLEEDYSEVVVSSSVVMLHHYKRCCGMTQTWFLQLFTFHVLKDEVVVDDTLTHHASGISNHSLVKLILDPTANLKSVDSLTLKRKKTTL